MGEPNLSPIGELSRAFGIEEVGIDRLRALAVSIGANMSPVPPVSVRGVSAIAHRQQFDKPMRW